MSEIVHTGNGGAWPRPYNDEDSYVKFSKPVIAAAALAVAVSLTACGSSDDGDSTTTTTATTSAESPSATAPPTVEEMNEKVKMALDPAVPAEEKAESVAGLDDDPELIQRVAEKIGEAEADGLFANVQVVGPLVPTTAEEVSVPITFEAGGETQQGALDVVLDDGEWKLAKSTVCTLANVLDVPSDSCPTVE